MLSMRSAEGWFLLGAAVLQIGVPLEVVQRLCNRTAPTIALSHSFCTR
jgi:hypothetical protein